MSKGQDPRRQMDRRRHTKVPGYYGVLPKVFPSGKKCSRSDAMVWIDLITDQTDLVGFAVTAHPSDQHDVVTLWLSTECAEYLTENGYINGL